jgi:MAternally-affected-uncoordination protein
MKSVKNTLKSLQHYIQSLTSRNDTSKPSSNENELINHQNPLENFSWLHKEHLGILVYLLTVIHSTQTGSFEKGQSYTEKALVNVQKLKLKEQAFNQSSFITNKFHIMFLENQIRSSIAVGNRCNALKYLGEAFQLCDQEAILMQSNTAQLHCLLGIYCLSVNLRDSAIAQFNQSLHLTSDTDLWLYNVMSLVLCHLSSWVR